MVVQASRQVVSLSQQLSKGVGAESHSYPGCTLVGFVPSDAISKWCTRFYLVFRMIVRHPDLSISAPEFSI